MRSWIRNRWRRVPAVARRDAELARRAARITELEARVAEGASSVTGATGTKSQQPAAAPEVSAPVDPDAAARDPRVREALLTRPSFRHQIGILRRMAERPEEHDPDVVHPFRHLPFKLRTQQLGASHGIPVPQVYRVWPALEDIDLDGLPDALVLKSDRGAGGKGVIQVHRVGQDQYRVPGHPQPRRAAAVVAQLATVAQTGKISGPYFAEELLRTPAGDPVTDDIKLYACYGQVVQVLLRRMSDPGDPTSIRHRYLTAEGTDLKKVAAGLSISAAIPVPAGLDAAVATAQHLSRAVGLPFCRVDLYETDHGVVLGELTRAPGGPQRYLPRHDRAMGAAWEVARWRLERDLADGRPFGLLFGEHPAATRYPDDHPSHDPADRHWNRPVVACEQWCFG